MRAEPLGGSASVGEDLSGERRGNPDGNGVADLFDSFAAIVCEAVPVGKAHGLRQFVGLQHAKPDIQGGAVGLHQGVPVARGERPNRGGNGAGVAGSVILDEEWLDEALVSVGTGRLMG